MDCKECPNKDAIIQRQQKEILRLQRIIKNAQIISSRIIDDANTVMSSHQPRSKWAYAKGALQAAQTILNQLTC